MNRAINSAYLVNWNYRLRAQLFGKQKTKKKTFLDVMKVILKTKNYFSFTARLIVWFSKLRRIRQTLINEVSSQ